MASQQQLDHAAEVVAGVRSIAELSGQSIPAGYLGRLADFENVVA